MTALTVTRTLPASVFTAESSPKMSARYRHINSASIVEAMCAEGFQVDSVTTRGSRQRDPLCAKHQIDFRHPDIPGVDGAVPRVLFTNSHDGSGSASFMMGVYRFVCSNGLIIGSTYAKEVTRHSGEQAAQLVERVRALSRNTAPLFAQIEQWSKRELSRPEEIEFARLASVLRFGDAQRFDPMQLLDVRRGEDEGRSLWRVFNRVQEAAVRMPLEGASADGRRLVSRPLKSLDAGTAFNTQLWRLAEEFA
jgi:hypothetical protein